MGRKILLTDLNLHKEIEDDEVKDMKDIYTRFGYVSRSDKTRAVLPAARYSQIIIIIY